jgi:hypothetical protein
MRTLFAAGFGTCLALLADAASVNAQIFISHAGNDANICSRAAPCRTLQRGINATGSGREMTILTSGQYGTAAIGKSITIIAEGISANVRGSGASAITIDNPAATVVLRGLFVTGGGAAIDGIVIKAAAAVHIVECEVERFIRHGIHREDASGDQTELSIADSISRRNGQDGLFAGLGTAKLQIDNSRFEGNGSDGLTSRADASSITRTVAYGNDGNGIVDAGEDMSVAWTTAAENGGSGYAVFNSMTRLESSVAHRNSAAGLKLNFGSSAVISNLTVTDDAVGLDAGAGSTSLLTRQNNTVQGNGTAVIGTLIPLAAR